MANDVPGQLASHIVHTKIILSLPNQHQHEFTFTKIFINTNVQTISEPELNFTQSSLIRIIFVAQIDKTDTYPNFRLIGLCTSLTVSELWLVSFIWSWPDCRYCEFDCLFLLITVLCSSSKEFGATYMVSFSLFFSSLPCPAKCCSSSANCGVD